MIPCLSLYCFLVFGPPALALDPGFRPPVSRATGTSIQSYGRDKGCASWTDSCTVCTRQGLGPASCSTPGIACTPGPITCEAGVP